MWNAGYVSEVDYIYGYFPELSPIRLKLALLSRGVSHDVSDSPNYLELGFGQGISLNINAATSSGEFYGTDFNPSQAAYARQIARAAGKSVKIYDDAFEAFAARADLPQFDIIALHGIWSWISAEGRQAIVDVISDRLKPGGVLYVSYNAKPGWAPIEPLRHLLNIYSTKAATGNLLTRVEESLNFVQKVVDTNSGYFAQYPAIGKMINAIRALDRNYVSHEYFNRNWLPESFSEVSARMSEAKMDFAASANLIENVPGLGVPPHCQEILSGISDLALFETTRDYMVNRQFRRDIYVKGRRQMSSAEIVDRMHDYTFIALANREELPLDLTTAAGPATLREDIYRPVWQTLRSAPDGEMSFGALAEAVATKDVKRAQLAEVLFVLTGRGDVAPVTQSVTCDEDNRASIALNRELCRRSQYSAGVNNLAAPRIGGAVTVGRIQQLILLGMWEKVPNVEEAVLETLWTQGERLMREGEVLQERDDNLAELRKLVAEVRELTIPMLQKLGAVDDSLTG